MGNWECSKPDADGAVSMGSRAPIMASPGAGRNTTNTEWLSRPCVGESQGLAWCLRAPLRLWHREAVTSLPRASEWVDSNRLMPQVLYNPDWPCLRKVTFHHPGEKANELLCKRSHNYTPTCFLQNFSLDVQCTQNWLHPGRVHVNSQRWKAATPRSRDQAHHCSLLSSTGLPGYLLPWPRA